jgi:hypothetical protein
MSRRRRRSGSGSGNQPGQQNQSNQQNRQNQPAQQGQQNRSKAAAAAEAFWGDTVGAGDDDQQAPAAVERIRPTPDPGALPRSLGDPPLTPDTAAAHHVAVVYEEAVRAATALAAANGLLDLDDVPSD